MDITAQRADPNALREDPSGPKASGPARGTQPPVVASEEYRAANDSYLRRGLNGMPLDLRSTLERGYVAHESRAVGLRR